MEHNHKGDCGICKIPYFERNNYFYGKLMTVRDFFAEQCYFNEKRWLMNRMTVGYGVVCGLEVKPIEGEEGMVKVMPGMAIDCCGREIVVCKETRLAIQPPPDECAPEEHNKGDGKKGDRENYYIGLEFMECKTEAIRTSYDVCDKGEGCEFNRIRDSFHVRVLRPSEVELPEDAGLCPLEDMKRTGEEKRNDCIDQDGREQPDSFKTRNHPGKYICREMMDHCPSCPETPVNHAVIIARVTLKQGEVVRVTHCRHFRKQVYSNKMLSELIDCYHGDLPHVVDTSWKELHNERIDWKTFKDWLLNEGLTITFDKPMIAGTINRHTVLFTVTTIEGGTGYRVTKQIPLKKAKYDAKPKDEKQADSHEPEATLKTLKEFHFKAEDEWKKDEVTRTHSELKRGAVFQIILKSDHILDNHGKALDGNYLGGRLPSGNGTQGGDFVSWFTVEPRRKSKGDHEPEPKKDKVKEV